MLLGRDNWLFTTNDQSVADFMGTKLLSDADLAHWRAELVARHDTLAAQGIHYYFLIAPNKESIYPEYMPYARPRGVQSDLDRLLALFDRGGRPGWIIDPRPALLATKNALPLYHPIDVHWNDWGGFIGYGVLAGQMARDGVAVNRIAVGDGAFRPQQQTDGDLPNMMRLTPYPIVTTSAVYGGAHLACDAPVPAPPVADATQPPVRGDDVSVDCAASGNATRVLIFHDSMIDALRRYIYPSFGHARLIWNFPSLGDIMAYADVEHPRVVVEERVERALVELPPSHVPPAALTTAPGPAPDRRGGWAHITRQTADRMTIEGWAYWVPGEGAPLLHVSATAPAEAAWFEAIRRDDVVAAMHDPRLRQSGFVLKLRFAPGHDTPATRHLCLWSEDKVYGAYRLSFVGNPGSDRCAPAP